MHDFFAVYKGTHEKFAVFSSSHILILATICALILSIIIFRNNLQSKRDFYRYFIALISLILECSYLVWIVRVGKWDIKTSLPLELCEITLILCIIMVIAKSYKIFEVVYSWGFIGSTLALLFPNLHVSYQHFTFWAFMLTHSLNLIALVFMMAVENYKPTRQSIKASFIITNIYMFFITMVNYFLGSNYFYYYVFGKPAPNIPNPFMYIRPWFFKILLLEGVILLALFICYLPYTLKESNK